MVNDSSQGCLVLVRLMTVSHDAAAGGITTNNQRLHQQVAHGPGCRLTFLLLMTSLLVDGK